MINSLWERNGKIMAGGFSKTEHLYGKWYSSDEADNVQEYLIKNEGTGVSWNWYDKNGNKITGSNR
jgi:hypothetical protein